MKQKNVATECHCQVLLSGSLYFSLFLCSASSKQCIQVTKKSQHRLRLFSMREAVIAYSPFPFHDGKQNDAGELTLHLRTALELSSIEQIDLTDILSCKSKYLHNSNRNASVHISSPRYSASASNTFVHSLAQVRCASTTHIIGTAARAPHSQHPITCISAARMRFSQSHMAFKSGTATWMPRGVLSSIGCWMELIMTNRVHDAEM